jgi:hypothetical protein
MNSVAREFAHQRRLALEGRDPTETKRQRAEWIPLQTFEEALNKKAKKSVVKEQQEAINQLPNLMTPSQTQTISRRATATSSIASRTAQLNLSDASPNISLTPSTSRTHKLTPRTTPNTIISNHTNTSLFNTDLSPVREHENKTNNKHLANKRKQNTAVNEQQEVVIEEVVEEDDEETIKQASKRRGREAVKPRTRTVRKTRTVVQEAEKQDNPHSDNAMDDIELSD